jgi:predicted AAA+ superfamily ATPase
MMLEMERRVVERDLAAIIPMDGSTKVKVMRLMHVLALNDRTSIESLSRDLDIAKPTLIAVLAALERAGLLLRVRPFGSQATRNRKTSRYLFMASSLRAAHFDEAGRPLDDHRALGPLLEDAFAAGVQMQEWRGPRLQVEYDHHQGGADFIVGNGFDPPVAVEIGYGKKDDEQVIRTSERVDIRYGITISNKGISLSDDGKIIRIPRETALLLL